MPDATTNHPVILAFEASGDQASSCLLLADGTWYQQVHQARHGHASLITELGRQVIDQAGIPMNEITHVAAGRGPGSFTGIRVALAAAKGFSLAIGARGIGVSCLAAMASAARSSADLRSILATADTRRGSYFAQLFDPDGTPHTDILEMDPESDMALPVECNSAAILGAGANPIIAAAPDSGLKLLDHPAIDARQIASFAACRIRGGQELDPLVPLYVAPAFLGPKRA